MYLASCTFAGLCMVGCARRTLQFSEMHVLMLQGWEKSAGVTDEIECYARAGKPILYIPGP